VLQGRAVAGAPADETALFLPRIADLPEAKQRMIAKLHESDEPLRARKVLVVDDDVRNIFALNSLLERHGMSVITATNGHDAISCSTPSGSFADLTDVHDAGNDGYETMRRSATSRVPHPAIIALTAKAMKGTGRNACRRRFGLRREAVNTEQLLSLVRMWLQP